MSDTAPFRERPRFLLCPRCGELLDEASDAALTCLRCEGVWIATTTVEKAFGDRRWPSGSTLWWRNELECPECASIGSPTVMAAAGAGEVVVDRCPAHGLWLDRGELCRLMGVRAEGPAGVSPDLALLHDKLATGELDVEQLRQRREDWRADLDRRRKAALEYRAWLEAEHERRAAAAASERAVRESEERAARAAAKQREEAERAKQREDAEARQRREAAEAEAARTKQHDEAALAAIRNKAWAEEERRRSVRLLREARHGAIAEVARTEAELVALRYQLRGAEAALEDARGRLRAIDDQLAMRIDGSTR